MICSEMTFGGRGNDDGTKTFPFIAIFPVSLRWKIVFCRSCPSQGLKSSVLPPKHTQMHITGQVKQDGHLAATGTSYVLGEKKAHYIPNGFKTESKH